LACPPVAGLAPQPDTTTTLALEPYLARAVAMNGLCDELVPAPFAWNTTASGLPCYTGGPAADPRSYRDSLACCGSCAFPFCPANFAEDVVLLVRLRATFVQYAASSWDYPEKFIPGSPFLQAAAETVRRINAAYDCAGVPRPFIQASVLENIGTGRTCAPPAQPCEPWMRPGPVGTNSGANFVTIPPSVITEFRDEILADSAATHYLDAAGAPRADVRFNFFRIAYRFMGDSYSPDITRLEGRLWLFYQATCFLDAGFTSLHMGQPKVWARLYMVQGTARAARLHQTAQLMVRIRRYARLRPGAPGPGLLLEAEPMADSDDRTIVKFEDSPGRLIYDLNLATMRPRETSPALDERARTQRGTGYRCPAVNPAALATPACAGQYLATIDPCHGFNFTPDGGGRTPLGFTYASQAPYMVYFDHGSTVNRLPSGELAATKVLWPGNSGTWGWDDAAWFSAALDDGCQADWLRVQFAQVRSLTTHGSFLAVPGRLGNNPQAGLAPPPGRPAHPEAGVPDYRLAAHPAVVQAVLEAWEPRAPLPTLAVVAGAGLPLLNCPEASFFRRIINYLPAWQLAITQPDVTSVYSWRIDGPRGPEPVLYGLHPVFYPSQPGAYTVVLRQDNLGLPAATGGRRRVELPALPPVEAVCLSHKDARQARRQAPQTTDLQRSSK